MNLQLEKAIPVFELNLTQNELEALDTILIACVDSEENRLPSWSYMGHDVWKMGIDDDVVEVTSDIPTAIVDAT